MIIGDYIRKSREAGFTDDQIRKALLQAGWQTDAIEQALIGKFNQDTQPPAVSFDIKTTQPVQPILHKRKNIFRRWWFYLVLIATVAFAAGIYFIVQQYIPDSGPEEVLDQDVEKTILIQNQVVMNTIHIDKVVVREKAFLIIQLSDDRVASIPNPNSQLAYSNLLNPDTYENFDLFTSSDPEVRMDPGTILFATLYKDTNNDRYYNLYGDTEIVLNASGEKEQITFYAK